MPVDISVTLRAVGDLPLWLVQSNASQTVWGGAMNAILFTTAGVIEGVGWDRVVVWCEDVEFEGAKLPTCTRSKTLGRVQ